MAEKFITHNVYLESADFYVLIIEFPDEDVNDKLAILSREKGLVYKQYYEDFTLGTCLANSSPFFYHLHMRQTLMEKYEEIRAETLTAAFRFNPGLRPENVFINANNVLKTGSTVKKGEIVRPLIENDLWDQDPPLSDFGPTLIGSAPVKEDDDNPFKDDEEEGPPNMDVPTSPDNPYADNTGGGGNSGGDNVPYELVGHRWDKLGLLINIKKFEESEENLVALIGGSPFETTAGYHLLIVQLCIDDFSDVFHLLDTVGVSHNVTPNQLMQDLYELAIGENPFLKLENVDLKEVKARYKKIHANKNRNNRRMAAAAQPDRIINKKRKKRFADIPKEKLLGLFDELKKQVVGQDPALNNIAEAIQRASVGLKRPHEPLGVFMFTGNTGVGKTETAKVLADVLEAQLVRIDCSEYQHAHEVAKLTGSPPGYVGYEDGGHLVKEVAKNPFSIVLLDEIEKAHVHFHERVLQIIDDGILTDNKGKKISFRETMIIMTSNIGVKEVASIGNTVGFGDVADESEEKTAKARGEALKKKFKPEFLNRIDDVVHFKRLERDDYMHILDILLDEVQEQLVKSQQMKLCFNIGAKNFLLDKGIDKKFGARPMRRAIKSHLNTPLAVCILKDELDSTSKVTVSLRPDRSGLAFRQNGKRAKVKKEEEERS